ncbi:STAS domain-containing protein [Actinophytocola sediminis]
MRSEAFGEENPVPGVFSVKVEEFRHESLGETVVLGVVGEVDLVTAPVLEESISTAFARAPDMVVVDLSEVSFLASVGMSILIGCNERAGNTRFRLVASGAATFRPLELTGVADTISIYPTRDQALTEG